MMLRPSRESLFAAAANAWARVAGDGVADLRPAPSTIIEQAPQRTISRYLAPDGRDPAQQTPVLLVPPLAVPTRCFDLRRGHSLAEHLVHLGWPTYLVDYGAISFSDRRLGIEHWVDEVIPRAVQRVTADAGAARAHLIGWSLGGHLALLPVADGLADAASVSMLGTPFDFTKVTIASPIRQASQLTGGMLGTTLYRALGGAPAPLVRAGFALSGLDKYLTKPFVLALNLDDRELLAQIEAVDEFTANMRAYPGRTMGQLYHQFLRHNELAQGRIELRDRTIEIERCQAGVLAIAGSSDTLAPVEAVHRCGELLPRARVRTEVVPGGHLGIVSGRSAPQTTWQLLDEFMLDHDGEGVAAEAAASPGTAPDA